MKVCLVGFDSAPLLRGVVTGGSQRQLALLARHLARRGHEVTFVEAGQNNSEGMAEGVRVLPGWASDRGLRILRFFTYRMPNLKRVLYELDADVYYVRGLSYFTPAVIAASRHCHALSLLALVNDRDLDAAVGKSSFATGSPFVTAVVGPWMHRYFHWRVLPGFDWLIVQNSEQATICKQRGFPHKVIPSIIEAPPAELLSASEKVDVTWVGNVIGRLRLSKGVQELAALARLLPQVRFEVVGQLSSPTIQPFIDELKLRPNVSLRGFLSYYETLRTVASSRLVINTSPAEGFSNVMLEAWSLGKPTITLSVNPDQLLGPEGFGTCAEGDLGGMASAIRYSLSHESERRMMGERCRSYVATEHSADKVCDQYEELMRSLHATKGDT